MRTRVGLKFDKDKDLTQFCVFLTGREIPFALAGFKTVVMAEKDWVKLEAPGRALADKGRRVEIQKFGKRGRLPTTAEAEELLLRFVKAR